MISEGRMESYDPEEDWSPASRLGAVANTQRLPGAYGAV